MRSAPFLVASPPGVPGKKGASFLIYRSLGQRPDCTSAFSAPVHQGEDHHRPYHQQINQGVNCHRPYSHHECWKPPIWVEDADTLLSDWIELGRRYARAHMDKTQLVIIIISSLISSSFIVSIISIISIITIVVAQVRRPPREVGDSKCCATRGGLRLECSSKVAGYTLH